MAEKERNLEDEAVQIKQEVVVKEECTSSNNEEESDDEEGDEVHNICQRISPGTRKTQEMCEKRTLSPSPTADPTRRYRCWKSTKTCHGDVATSEGKNQENTCLGATHSKETKVLRKILQDIGDEAAGSSSSSSKCNGMTRFVPISGPVKNEQEVCNRGEDSTNKTNDLPIVQGIKSEPLCTTSSVSSVGSSANKTNDLPIEQGIKSEPLCTTSSVSSDASSTVQQPLHINELPILLMSKILSYLTVNQLLCTASLVCKIWYRIAREPGLWKKIVLDRPGIVDEDLYHVVRINPNMSQLCITDCRLLTGAGVAKALVVCSSVKELVIMRCNQLQADAFCDIGPNCRELTKVNFSNSIGVDDEAIENIAAHCPNLTELRLNHCSYISDTSIQKLAKGCPKLKTLTFQENKRITDVSLSAVCDHSANMEVLSLHKCAITNQGLNDLHKAVCDHSANMEVLSLHKCAITNQGLNDLHKLTKLRNLDLSNIASLSPYSVADAISNIPQLDTLNLCLSRHINDSCLQCIAASCKKLKYLFLVSCNISDEGLISIGRNSRSIEHVDVGWCRDVTDRGATALSQMCPQLKYLGMVRCDKITEACVTRLVKEYPHIHYSTFLLDSQRLLEKAKQQGYLTYNV